MKRTHTIITALLIIGTIVPSNILVFGESTDVSYSQTNETEVNVTVNLGNIELAERIEN